MQSKVEWREISILKTILFCLVSTMRQFSAEWAWVSADAKFLQEAAWGVFVWLAKKIPATRFLAQKQRSHCPFKKKSVFWPLFSRLKKIRLFWSFDQVFYMASCSFPSIPFNYIFVYILRPIHLWDYPLEASLEHTFFWPFSRRWNSCPFLWRPSSYYSLTIWPSKTSKTLDCML